MTLLLRVSRLASGLAKMADDAAAVGLMPGQAPQSKVVNGLEGRFMKPMVGGMKVRKTEGPRAYAPRLDKT